MRWIQLDAFWCAGMHSDTSGIFWIFENCWTILIISGDRESDAWQPMLPPANQMILSRAGVTAASGKLTT